MEPYRVSKLPIADIDWTAHVSLIGKANAALARYDGMLQSIVNPAVLLSPLTTQEAVLSSRIEGTQPDMEEVLRFEADPQLHVEASRKNDIHEIINYRKAMVHAVSEIGNRPFCLNLIKELHNILLDSVRGRDKARGQFRRTQNFIGHAGDPIEKATFVPPVWDQVESAMSDWESYFHTEEKDHLVQLALIKAQFELIHPFLDGNGRLGRMLIPLFLFEKRILSSPMFYLSSYLEKNRDAYIARLKALSTENDWDGWIAFFLAALAEQAEANAVKTRKILNLYEEMKRKIPGIVRSRYSIQAIDAVFDRPIFQSGDFIIKSGIPRESALRILSELKKAGFLKDLTAGRGRRAAVVSFSQLIQITEEGA